MKKFRKIFLLLVVVFAFGLIKPVYATPAGGHGDFTQDELNEIFAGITINANERDYYVKCEDSDNYCVNEELETAIENSIQAKWTASGYGDDYSITSIVNTVDVHSFLIHLHGEYDQVDNDGIVTVAYNNTDTTILQARQNMSAILSSYPVPPYFTYDINSEDGYHSIGPSNGLAIFRELLVKNKMAQNIKEFIGDDDIEVLFKEDNMGYGASLNENASLPVSGAGAQMEIIIYKDGKFYAKRGVNIAITSGFRSKEGYIIQMIQLANDPDYQKMVAELEKLGAKDVVFAYYLEHLEVGAPIPTEYKLDLNVGEAYNGKYVTVLHKKQDGSYEHFVVKVKDGKASITTSELSPFMVAVNTDQEAAAVAAGDKTADSSNPQTSSVNILLYIIVASLSLVGIIYLAKRKKRIV